MAVIWTSVFSSLTQQNEFAAMIKPDHRYSLSDFIHVVTVEAKDAGWPTPSPFTLQFRSQKLSVAQREVVSGRGIYLIVSSDSAEVIYLGSYKPDSGNIIEDRWCRHLQTITGRGCNIGLGKLSGAERRVKQLLDVVEAKSLRHAIENSYLFSRESRFRDTGYCTTPNRLRFASEHWNDFETATSSSILCRFEFWLFRTGSTGHMETSDAGVSEIERRVLQELKPICNSQYNDTQHRHMRRLNTIESFSRAIRHASQSVTGQANSQSVQLAD